MKLRLILLAGFAGLFMSLTAQTHEQGIEYYKADQLNNAQELLLRNLNNANTDKALSYYYLGEIELRQDKTAKAEEYFNKGLAANAENPYNYIGLGYIALKNGDTKGAEKYFKEAESRAKKDMSVQVDIARAYYNANPVEYKDKYEKRIDNALKKDMKNPDIYIFQGDVLRDLAYKTQSSADYGKAAAKYDMAKGYDPSSAVAYVKYADMYTNANNPGYAITNLEELIKNNPESALGQRQLANLYYDTNNYKKAAQLYGEYVNNPNHFKEDEDRYSFILFADDRYKDGYDYASKLVSQNPDNFTAMRFQFMNAAQLDSMKDSMLPMAEKLLAKHKANPDANKFAPIDYNLIVEELVNAKRFDEAIAVLNEAMTVFPDNSNFNKNLATLYLDAQDYGKAADSYVDYIAKLGNPAPSDYLQVALYAYYGGVQNANDEVDKTSGEVVRAANPDLAQKYYSMAKQYAQKSLDANPSQYRPYKVMGDVDIAVAPENQRATAGQPMYIKAVELIGENPSGQALNDAKNLYNYLGNYNLEMKNVDKAKEYFNKYLQLDPDNAEYRKFVESLK